VIESDGTLVEAVVRCVVMFHEADGDATRVIQVPNTEAWSLVSVEKQPEAQHLRPPADGERTVRHREVDVPEAFESGGSHRSIVASPVPAALVPNVCDAPRDR